MTAGSGEVHPTQVCSLFKQVLGDAFEQLPPAVRDLHSKAGLSVFKGRAESLGPKGVTGFIGAIIGRFPRKPSRTPVRVEIDALDQHEVWTRQFGDHAFSSVLSRHADSGAIERFGPFSFHIDLHLADGRLHYPVTKGWMLGILPIPAFLLPQSTAFEFEDGQGRFNFDVLVKLRTGGRIAHYKGWLEEAFDE